MSRVLFLNLFFSVSLLFAQDPMLDPNMLFEKEMLEAAEAAQQKAEPEKSENLPEAETMEIDQAPQNQSESQSNGELQEMNLRYEARILRLEKELTRLLDRIARLEQSQIESAKKAGGELIRPRQDVLVDHYSQALELFTEKKFEEAQRLFTEIVRQNDSNLVWYNAMYWNAECSFHMNKLNEALILLSDVLEHPDQSMREKSLLLMAVALEKLNRIQEAQQYYQQFIRSYPFSNYAPIVRKKLGMS
ncbi:MAG TPA: tetratricopeptide repeat protein [Candidatus Marinimicrobia bacterium]|nr:tetratricopeptide repeat protein [Candidatus Neomarinimicrobiota bacterium]